MDKLVIVLVFFSCINNYNKVEIYLTDFIQIKNDTRLTCNYFIFNWPDFQFNCSVVVRYSRNIAVAEWHTQNMEKKRTVQKNSELRVGSAAHCKNTWVFFSYCLGEIENYDEKTI